MAQGKNDMSYPPEEDIDALEVESFYIRLSYLHIYHKSELVLQETILLTLVLVGTRDQNASTCIGFQTSLISYFFKHFVNGRCPVFHLEICCHYYAVSFLVIAFILFLGTLSCTLFSEPIQSIKSRIGNVQKKTNLRYECCQLLLIHW